ncbi:unnamed protein product [Cercospora beticola]|nr:unnamed protein product [Cercospora beticola]
MVLSCESAGHGPNGPLDKNERRVYQHYAWAPQADRSPARYVYHQIFHTTSLGFPRVADFPSPTVPEPMEIDSAPAPQIAQAETSDIDMEDAPAVRRVQWTPPADYSRPSSRAAIGNMLPRTALSKRIHLINHLETYVPKEPYPLNLDVDISHPSIYEKTLSDTPPVKPLHANTAGKTPPATKVRASNTFSVPDDSSFSELSPEHASTPFPFSARQAKSWRISPPKQRVTPEGRPILSPVSPRESTTSTSPPRQQTTLSPEVLYPSLQVAGRSPPQIAGQKRRFEDAIKDVYEEDDDRPQTVAGCFFGVVRTVVSTVVGWLSRVIPSRKPKRTTQEQEIFALRLSSRESNKRRAIRKEDIEADPMPGYYPGSAGQMQDMIAPAHRSAPNASTLATPPDSRPGSMEKSSPVPTRTASQSRSMPNMLQEYTNIQTQLPSPKEEPGSMNRSGAPTADLIDLRQNFTASSQLQHQTLRRAASMKQPLQPSTHPATIAARKAEEKPQKPKLNVPFRMRGANYSKAKFPPMKTKAELGLLPPRNPPDRATHNKEANERVDALVEKAQRITIEPPEQKSLRESVRARKHRQEQEDARQQQIAKVRQAEEEARLQAEREAEEAKQKAEEERKQAEEAAAAEAARRKEALENFMPTISEDWQQTIARELATTDPVKTVAHSTRGVELTRKTFGCILPQQNEHQIKAAQDPSVRRGPSGWLNDEGVDGFIGAIVDRKREQEGYVKGKGTPSYAAFGCAWYTTVKKGTIKSISRWARRQQIGDQKLLECEKIFFPVNTGAHWVLLIISPKDRTLEFLDSAGGSGRSFFRLAREWLAMELGTKYVEDEWRELESKSQLQMNMDDCGVFTCMNALASAKGLEFEAVKPVRDMKRAREYITCVLLDGGFGKSFEL